MDAKDLKTDLAVGARNDGSNKYGQGSITCDRNKPYQEVGSNSLGKVDVQTSRPCAVIGPDRVVAPVAADVYLKKPPDQWLHPEHPYRRPPDYPLKMTDFQSPTRNISPRQTFQENMQRIMVPPTYNSLKLNSDSALSDTNVPLPKNKLNVSTDPKYCEVPYNISPLTGEPKSYKNVDISVSIGNPTVNQSAPYLWPATSVQQSRPYGASEFYPYADYSGCSGVRTMPNSRPHRLLSEETSSTYPERYFADNVRFKPYPTIKEGYPQQRYECMSNYSNSYHPPPYPPPRYDLQKPVVPHMYSSYPQVPVKYIDNRMAEPAVDGFQRSNPPPNYSVAFHNQFIHPAYGPVPGNCVQNKMFSYPPEVSVKQNHMTKLAYENNKVYSDFDIRNKNYGIPEHYYGNDMIRAHSSKGQVMLSKHPPPNSAIPGHSYYRNPQFRNYDHNIQLKNTDYSLNMTSPIMRFTPHFSPNSSSMSPLESSSIHSTIQDENIYLGQKPVGSMRNADMRRIKTDMYGRFGTGLHRNSASYGDHKASNSSKDKKNIDVRQFLQQWNDDDENYDSNSSKQENIQNSNEKNQTGQNIKNQDQLYVLGLVNVPSEELSKYEHIQKISKLPDNIKGYNSLELLNQFEEAIEISNLNSNASATAKMCDVQAPMKQLPIQRATVPPQPRPVSPLDVEAKISQSVIHKEVGCNFEIKPCSPKMLNADVAAPVQTILDERVIEKLTNPHGIKSPISKPSNNIISFSIPKNEDNQINLMHQKLKNPSCKLTNQFNSDEFIQPNKGNYSLNDLEGSSGVCLASLPRLDNEIEFNFPEVNQQFIDANKPESLISSTTSLDPKSDSDYQRLKTSSPLKEHSLSSHLNADSSSYPKLSKYRKVKKVDNDSPLEVHFPVQAMRTDSVIIKNETAKESNVNTGFEKLLENTSSSKYEEIRQHTSSPAISIKSEEKEELIESLLEKEEISNDVIDFSVNKNNSSSTSTNNENNDNDFEVGLCDTSSTQKCSEISVQKSFDILISDIYSRRTPDKLYKNVISPVNSNNDDNVVNPLVNDDLNTKSEMFSKTIKREQKEYVETVDKSVINISSQSDISQYLIEKQIPDREIKTNLEASCYSTEKDESAQDVKHLSECDRNTEPKEMCLNMEVKVRNIDIEHSCNTSSETNSTYENNGFLVPMPTPSRSPIPDDPKASDTENNLSWFRKEKSLEVVTIDYIGTSIHMHESGSLSRHDESLNVDNLPLINKDNLKTNNNEMVLKEQSCKTENSYQDDPIFNISENYCKTLGQCIESKNLEFEKKDSNEMCAVRNKCDEISVLYSDMDMDLNDSQLSNKPIMEDISEEEVDICNSDTSVIAKRYINKGIDEICIVKACDKVSVSNSYTNENSAEVNRTGNKQVIVENNHSEIGVPSSNSNIDVSLSTSSDEVMDIGRDETYVSNNNTKAEASNIIENGSDHKSFDLISESKCDTNTTEFNKNDRNQPMIVENHCEDIDVSGRDTNVNASGLHINKCERATVKKAEETCTIESTAQKTNESCELIENTLGVENHHSSISLNTTMHTKLNHLHPENFQNNDTIKSSDKKISRADNNEHIVFQDSGNISDYKLTSKVHKDFVEVQNFDDPISLEKDYKSKERLQSLQTELEHEIVNVKNEDKNMFLHESSPSSSTRNNNQSTLQKIFQYGKVCDKPVPIKQYSPWIQKLMLFHEGIFPLPMISCSDQNNEVKKCKLLLNNVYPNITPAEESMEISVNDVQEENIQFPQFSVLTLKDIASRVLQNCSEKSGIDDANKASPENSVLNLPSDKLDCKTYTPKPPSSLKRSLSDSALNIFDDQSCATDHLWPKRRKPEKDSIQKKLLAENYCQLLQNQRRNSISTIFNEDISICILLDDNCIITEEGEEIDQNYVEEAKSDSVHDKLFEDFNNISKLDNQKLNDDILEIKEKPTETCWIEDVACVETVVSDNIEDNEAGIDYTKEENYVDMVSLPNNDACVETDVSDNNEENEVGIDYTKEANEVNMVSLPNNHACVEADGSDNNEENEVGIDYTEEANYVETNSDACAKADISDNIEDNKVGFDYSKEENYVDMVSFPNNDAHIKPDISDNIEENEMGTNYSKEENFVDMVSLPNSDACVETDVSDNIEEDEVGTNYSKEENYVDMVSLPNSDACVETDVSDNTEDTEVGIDYSKEENYVDIVSLPNNDAISKYDFEYKEESAINLTRTVKSINYDHHSEVLINNPCQVSPMDYNIINTEDADRQTLENILTGTDSIKTINDYFDVLDANTTISRDNKTVPINKPFIETIKGKDNVSLIDKECNKKIKIDSAQPTQYDIIHSCESSIDNVFTYENKEDITRYSTSPEVSSTTSEDRCSSILLKITNYQGSIISELSNNNDTRRISCKYTENNDYNKSNNKSSSNRPLITKAAQKYIPPLSESIPDLKVKLPLSPHSLLKFKDLKMAKEFPKIDPKLQKRTNIEPSLPKKVKPKFEDVLKSIDEIQIKMHKEKSKKIKKSIPKVVIKKGENGSHYTSSQNNELSDPDLTGRKWQPWVFIERNRLVDNMVTKKKTKAIFSHRKNEFVLKDTFRKYKSVSSAKFVISQPRVDKLSKGQLKYTIKLKHSY